MQEWATNMKMVKSSWLASYEATTKIWLASLVLNLILEIKRRNIRKILQNVCDLINAINWLPKDSILWAGHLGNSFLHVNAGLGLAISRTF